jgi:hypothetical protein
MRTRLRRLRFGLSTILGIAERGFFIPYRYAGGIARAERSAPYPELERIFQDAEPAFAELLDEIALHATAIRAIAGGRPPEPRFEQDWFPRFDAVAAYALVRKLRPRRIVEIGSGHSTRFMARAIRDGALQTAITAIDPAPRADIAGLGVATLRSTLQAGGTAPFAELARGDILFVDSSHILMPGSDVDFLLGRVLPALPAGVHVHFHDVFLPDGYPESWLWRGYNEQTAVAALLQGSYRLRWSSRYVTTRMAPALKGHFATRLPFPEGAFETSLWLVKERG